VKKKEDDDVDDEKDDDEEGKNGYIHDENRKRSPAGSKA
jgi:hypothetical protein